MKEIKVKIEPEALQDIREITKWYTKVQPKLGKRFQNTIIKQIDSLHKNPHGYAIRYKEIRCLPVKKFPYMVHFYINEGNDTVEVLAIISTDRNPKVWEQKTVNNI